MFLKELADRYIQFEFAIEDLFPIQVCLLNLTIIGRVDTLFDGQQAIKMFE